MNHEKTTPETAPVFLTVKQVAARVSVSTPTVYRWVREGTFPRPVKLGANCTRWRLADLERWEATRGEVA